jgi:hypothetical protein
LSVAKSPTKVTLYILLLSLFAALHGYVTVALLRAASRYAALAKFMVFFSKQVSGRRIATRMDALRGTVEVEAAHDLRVWLLMEADQRVQEVFATVPTQVLLTHVLAQVALTFHLPPRPSR